MLLVNRGVIRWNTKLYDNAKLTNYNADVFKM